MKKIYIVLSLVLIIPIFILGISKPENKKETRYLVPLGNVVGIRANTDGILVLENEDSSVDYIDGVDAGDNIISINGINVYSSKDVKRVLHDYNKDLVEIIIDRDGELISKQIPVKKENNEYKLGIWIRDKISGIGTMTFYNPQNNTFSALGHPIKDVDTNELIKVKSGNIYNAEDISIEKGRVKHVGQIKAEFDGDKPIGNFKKNNSFGISGNLTTYDNEGKEKMLEVGDSKDIKLGPAIILFQNKDGKIGQYQINIKKIKYNNKKDDKDMVIEVVDERLINYTGGIVQGMSGAPIIQNDKIIGAVTHVFIDNSKIGYGIFIDKMII